MSSTLVVSNNEAVSARLREVFLREGYECAVYSLAAGGPALVGLGQNQPGIVTLVLSPDPEAALAFLAEVRDLIPGRVLAVGPALDPKLILRALREGADQYVDEADLDRELVSVLLRLRAQGGGRTEPARLVCVLRASGGSGASTIAVNLATALAREHKSAALFDLKPGAGDLGALLDLKPTHTLADLCQNVQRMDRVMFERSLTRHESGVHLLAPPPLVPGEPARVPAHAFGQALVMARALFPYVVADLADCYHDEQAEALRQADVILLVLRLDFTSLRNARTTLDHFEHLGIDPARVRLVANRYGQPKEVPYAKAEEALGVKIAYYIPDDPKTVNWSNNHGIPAVVSSPRAGVARSLLQLAQGVNGRHKDH